MPMNSGLRRELGLGQNNSLDIIKLYDNKPNKATNIMNRCYCSDINIHYVVQPTPLIPQDLSLSQPYIFIPIIMSILKSIPILLLLLALAIADTDKGAQRLAQMRKRSQASPNRIIQFNAKDFTQHVMRYPRPYDVVMYFYAEEVPLSSELYEEFNYTVQLHVAQGVVDAEKYPTFFARIDFSQENYNVFGFFKFNSAPNLVVSKPEMAILGESQGAVEVQSYLKRMCWRISNTDGVVTTHKMLQFINKRTNLGIIYKPTEQTIKQVLTYFLALSVAAVLIYKLFRFIWSHWLFWFVMSMVPLCLPQIIYIICMTGIVHEILNGSIQEQWKNIYRTSRIFTRDGRQQTFLQGCFVSLVISMTGIVLIVVAVTGEKVRQRYSAFIGLLGIIMVYYAINYIELIYSTKSSYGPSFKPPDWYKHGPLKVDQGNTI